MENFSSHSGHNSSLLCVSGKSQSKPPLRGSSAFTTDLTAGYRLDGTPNSSTFPTTDPEGKTSQKMVKVNRPLEWALIQSA